MTQEKTFEEKFPSLKGKRYRLDDGYDSGCWMEREDYEFLSDSEKQEYTKDDDEVFISVKHLKEYCLDKQKIREAFEPIMNTIKRSIVPTMDDARETWRKLQELGLE